jgi:CubicO group peptidase (beta-lactamase class C family)
MAKSVESMLIGRAIADGLINGVDQPVTDFMPGMRKNGWDKVTLEHLLQMTSGMDFSESYVNPFGTAAKFYYGRRLYANTERLKLKRAPGERFEYVSGSTQLLGLILEQALRAKGDPRNMTGYLNDKLWRPLGMEYPSTWSIDRKEGGVEKAFCCINAPARDFTKLGSLYLHKGLWRGEQLVPAEWVERSTRVDTSNGSATRYQYQWWLPSQEGDFMAQGILGQFVYVDPSRELVIVRLGEQQGGWHGLQCCAAWPRRMVSSEP